MAPNNEYDFDDDYYEDETIYEDVNSPPDCLVLEIYANNEIYDERKRVYILYDINENKFILRGKQDDTENVTFNSFNFKSRRATNVANFLSLLFHKRSILEVAIYNFTDLPFSSNDITFEMLETNAYAEAIYTNDDFPLKQQKIRRLLNMLGDIYNDY